jgi:hypothetical protein
MRLHSLTMQVMSTFCHFSPQAESITDRSESYVVEIKKTREIKKHSTKGELVKKYFAIAFLLLSFVGLGTTARAQESTLVVTVPFEFVAGGTTLPAGKYTINTGSSQSDFVLSISGRDGSAVLLATSFDDYSDVNQLRLNFRLVDGKHLLSEVTTSAGTYNLVTRREMIRLAQMQEHTGMTSSGTN